MATPPADKSKLRTGYTTGVCTTAAAVAALRALRTQTKQSSVAITLPIGREVTFAVKRCDMSSSEAVCSVVKDAGDDPDVTDKAELTVTMAWAPEPGIRLLGGPGVGRVTKEGLGIPVGELSITPVPRKHLLDNLIRELEGETRGLAVTISVPGGEAMAAKTLNHRLGLVGGISILGTTGIVVPFSTAAYKESIVQAIDVALAAGLDEVVVTTGGKSEQYAQQHLSSLPEVAFVQMGDFVGFTLKTCKRKKLRRATIAGMIGKLSKMAKGKMQTHAAGSEVDMGLLSEIAAETGAAPEVVDKVKAANTGRHVGEIVQAAGVPGFFDAVCRRVAANAARHVGGGMAVRVLLVDFDGKLLGKAEAEP
jgi:cobalt-precorrin-5B (C1)-methyltransferase